MALRRSASSPRVGAGTSSKFTIAGAASKSVDITLNHAGRGADAANAQWTAAASHADEQSCHLPTQSTWRRVVVIVDQRP